MFFSRGASTAPHELFTGNSWDRSILNEDRFVSRGTVVVAPCAIHGEADTDQSLKIIPFISSNVCGRENILVIYST